MYFVPRNNSVTNINCFPNCKKVPINNNPITNVIIMILINYNVANMYKCVFYLNYPTYILKDSKT